MEDVDIQTSARTGMGSLIPWSLVPTGYVDSLFHEPKVDRDLL